MLEIGKGPCVRCALKVHVSSDFFCKLSSQLDVWTLFSGKLCPFGKELEIITKVVARTTILQV